jgi:hypothetical protein
VSEKCKAKGKKSQEQINNEKAAEYAAKLDEHEEKQAAKGRIFDPYELLARTEGIQTVDHPVLGTLQFGELTFEDAFEIDKCQSDSLKTETIAWLYATGGYYESTSITNENLMFTPAGYIPEFSSWPILPLLAVSTLVILGIRNKISKKRLKIMVFQLETRQKILFSGESSSINQSPGLFKIKYG